MNILDVVTLEQKVYALMGAFKALRACENQSDAVDMARLVGSLSKEITTRCDAAIVGVEQETPLSADEQALLNSWMEN